MVCAYLHGKNEGHAAGVEAGLYTGRNMSAYDLITTVESARLSCGSPHGWSKRRISVMTLDGKREVTFDVSCADINP